MSKEERYVQWGYESFKDTKTGEICENHIDLLNEQNREIRELKKALELACCSLIQEEYAVLGLVPNIKIEQVNEKIAYFKKQSKEELQGE